MWFTAPRPKPLSPVSALNMLERSIRMVGWVNVLSETDYEIGMSGGGSEG